MLSSNERITLRQFQILFVLEAFGTGFVVMPRLAARYAGQDGWLVALLLVIPGLIFAALIAGTARSFGSERFASYTRRLLSAPVAAAVCFMLWAKILFCAGLELRLFGEIVRALLLVRTPALAVYLVVLGVAAYAAAKGIETRARLAEILIVIIAVPLVVLGVVAVFSIDFTNLMPALVTPTDDLLSGVLSLGFIFTGLEFIFLAFPYLNKPQEGRKAAVHAMGFAGILMAVMTAATIAKFGPYNVQAQQWPILKMMDMISIPGSLIARQEALVLSFWMLSVFAFAAASLFYGAALGRDQVGKGKHGWWVAACAVIVCIVASLPFSQAHVYWLLNRIFLTFGLGFWVGIPIILLTAKKIRGKAR
ncbi:MAG: spore germination protein [Defluviitaleaceae bacterium]|nr:spore germination protein [Defluviitaleaceae bacterium]